LNLIKKIQLKLIQFSRTILLDLLVFSFGTKLLIVRDKKEDNNEIKIRRAIFSPMGYIDSIIKLLIGSDAI
jgi:hypothetical protein